MKQNGHATCTRNDCFAWREKWYNHENVCEILYENDFGKRSCPFFKTREQYEDDAIAYAPKRAKYRRGRRR